MPDLSFITNPEALLIASLLLFALFALLKQSKQVRRLLNTPRKKQIAVAVIAAGAVVAVTWNQVPYHEAIEQAAMVFLAAMGWHALRRRGKASTSKLEEQAGEAEK